MFIYACAHAQWVRPNQFTELTTVTDSTFEVYSQRFGLPRKASLTTIKKFMDQSLTISGDSICITKATGTTCVKLPAQAFTQKSQSWANSLVSQSYSIPADTVAKYDYLFVQYETNVAPSGSTITLPSPSATTSGKIIDVLVYLGPSATIQTATLSGAFATISGNTYAYPNSISAVTGHYRFVSTVAVSGGGYKWQLISSPATPTAAAASSKRVNSRVINSQSVVFTDTTFNNIDEFTIYAEAESGNTQLKVPVPDSSYAGKVIYYYPQKTGANTNTITCDAVRILEISQTTAFSTTTASSSTVTVPKKLTAVLYEGTYYWEMRNLYNDAGIEKNTFSASYLYLSTDTVKLDTVLKYDNIHVFANPQGGNMIVNIPQPTSATKGKTINFYPKAASNTMTISSLSGSYLGRYTDAFILDLFSTLAITSPISLVSNGNAWIWSPGIEERLAQNKLVGRFSSGTGQSQEISISSDFTMTGGTLALASAGSGYNFYTTTLGSSGRIIVAYQGSAPSASGSAGNYTLSIPANCRPISFSFSGAAADLTVGGAFNITCAWTSLPSSINTSVATAFLPSITITETTTVSRIQLNSQGTGYQITHPTIGTGSTTTTITGMNGIGNYIIKGVF